MADGLGVFPVSFLGSVMLWVKAGHIIFAIFLVSGLFMMPRFFVYHYQCPVGSDEDRMWVAREDRLRKIILNPALIIMWILGLMLAFDGGYWNQNWFLVKFAFLLGLSGYHGWLISTFKNLSRGERPYTEKTLRYINEIPGVAVAIIVILAVVRP